MQQHTIRQLIEFVCWSTISAKRKMLRSNVALSVTNMRGPIKSITTCVICVQEQSSED